MGNAVGDILPLALAVIVSPIPNVAMILILFSPKARTNGPAFLAGWIAGLALVGILVIVLSASVGLGSGGGGSSIVGPLLKILLGLALLWLAYRSFRKRPRSGEQPSLPGWMRAIDSATPAKILGIAVRSKSAGRAAVSRPIRDRPIWRSASRSKRRGARAPRSARQYQALRRCSSPWAR